MKPKTAINAIALTAGFILAWPQAQAAKTTHTRELVAFNNQGDLKIHATVVSCEEVNGVNVCTEIHTPVTDPALLAAIQKAFDDFEAVAPTTITRASAKASEEARRVEEGKIFTPGP